MIITTKQIVEMDTDKPITQTRSGHGVKIPSGLADYHLFTLESNPREPFTKEEFDFYNSMDELGELGMFGSVIPMLEEEETRLVGAATGGEFEHTSELRVMKYNQAMVSKHRKEWEKAIQEKFDKFEKYKTFDLVDRGDVSEHEKILTSTWAMEKKSNGTYRARLTA